MIIRCYTCNSYISKSFTEFEKFTNTGMSTEDALKKIGVVRICCRTRIITHVNLYEDFKKFPCVDSVLDDCDSTFYRKVDNSRRVRCDNPTITTIDLE